MISATYLSDPLTLQLSYEARCLGLFIRCMSAQNRQDGILEAKYCTPLGIARATALAEIGIGPAVKQIERCLDELIAVGVLERNEKGDLTITDYADFNPKAWEKRVRTRGRMAKLRARNAEEESAQGCHEGVTDAHKGVTRGAQGAHKGVTDAHNGVTGGEHGAHKGVTGEHPTRVDQDPRSRSRSPSGENPPTPPAPGGTKRKRKRGDLTAEEREQILSNLVPNDPPGGRPSDKVLRELRVIQGFPYFQEATEFMRWWALERRKKQLTLEGGVNNMNRIATAAALKSVKAILDRFADYVGGIGVQKPLPENWVKFRTLLEEAGKGLLTSKWHTGQDENNTTIYLDVGAHLCKTWEQFEKWGNTYAASNRAGTSGDRVERLNKSGGGIGKSWTPDSDGDETTQEDWDHNRSKGQTPEGHRPEEGNP